jgi:hypothetical protein
MTGPRSAAGRRAIPLVYILAASHSGSTLLALLLGRHPEISTIGELKLTALGDLERYRCGCGSMITVCPFWSEVARRMRARGIPFDLARPSTDFASGLNGPQRRLLAPLHRRPPLEAVRDAALALTPGWRRHLAAVQHANAALAATVLELTGRRVIVDSSKIGVRLKYLRRNAAFDVKVVRLVRDGRAVSLTYMDPAVYADAQRPELRGARDAEQLTMWSAAREWRRANEEAETLLRGLAGDRYIEVRYEDLCANPQAMLARLFRFLGVSPIGDASLIPAHRENHVVGNGMRLDWDGRIALDERWRWALTPADLQAFDREAGALNRRLGYSDHVSPSPRSIEGSHLHTAW